MLFNSGAAEDVHILATSDNLTKPLIQASFDRAVPVVATRWEQSRDSSQKLDERSRRGHKSRQRLMAAVRQSTVSWANYTCPHLHLLPD